MKLQTYEIKTVSIIGLGALGILFGDHLAKRMPKENIRIVADPDRIRRYREDGIFCNGERCDFNFISPEEAYNPTDLMIFTVKYQGLQSAIEAVRNQIGEHTIILSALNGITSEEIIGSTYGMDKLLYCVAQGMDAVKVGNRLTYDHMGMLVFGEKNSSDLTKVNAVADFFHKVDFPHQVDHNMMKRMWGKFMLNVGVNQTAAVSQAGNYGELQKEGPVRERMIAAMREVIALSEAENIALSEEDLNYWLRVLSTLSPQGKPSMRQDIEAGCISEVELFSGAVIQYGRKHQIETPVNEELYRTVKMIECNK